MTPDEIAPETRLDIQALVVEHAWMIDHHEVEGFADLYTEDGGLYGLGPPLQGRETIRAWIAQAVERETPVTRHVVSHVRLRTLADGVIGGDVTFMLFRAGPDAAAGVTPVAVSDYHDVYALEDGRWRFRERQIERVFLGAPPPVPGG